MSPSIYGYLWENGVSRIIKTVYESINHDAIDKFDVSMVEMDEQKGKVETVYNEYRDFLKHNLFNAGNEGQNLIDPHKISACIVGALVKCRSIVFRLSEDVPPEVYLSNYIIAFHAGVRCMRLFTQGRLKLHGEDRLFDKVDSNGFAYPKTNAGHDPYAMGRIKAMALNDFNNIDFDILSYADMLFWIERYNLERLQ